MKNMYFLKGSMFLKLVINEYFKNISYSNTVSLIFYTFSIIVFN